MKFRNIYKMCVANLEILNSLKIMNNKHQQFYEISNWNNICQAVIEMRDNIKYLEKEAEDFLESVPEVFRYENEFKLGYEKFLGFCEKKTILQNCMSNAIKLYESLELNTEERIGLDIKLPECDDFLDFKKCIDDLEYILYKVSA